MVYNQYGIASRSTTAAPTVDVSNLPKEVNYMCNEDASKIIYPRTVVQAIDDFETILPTIGENGNWFIGTVDTEVSANGVPGPMGEPGKDGEAPHIDEITGNWVIGLVDTGIKAAGVDGKDGVDGVNGADGINGETPYVDEETGHWFVGSADTGVEARGPEGPQGQNGLDGTDGITPHIDPDTKHWMIGTTDTGIVAEAVVTGGDGTSIKGDKGDPGEKGEKGDPGEKGEPGESGADGQDGITPSIDPVSKHWMIGDTDTGVVAEGQNGQDGTDGKDGLTPSIDPDTKHWMIGEEDTGVVAEGQSGSSGSSFDPTTFKLSEENLLWDENGLDGYILELAKRLIRLEQKALDAGWDITGPLT